MAKEKERPAPEGAVTENLRAFADGDADAFERVAPEVYPRLKRQAHALLRRRGVEKTLNTTGLVHELYLKLNDRQRAHWRDRSHFFASSARAMRHILVDAARRRLAAKRGAGKQVQWDGEAIADRSDAETVMAVHQALALVAEVDERLCRVVECRYFAGMTEPETAATLGISERTVHRDWIRARALLTHELAPRSGAESPPDDD